jgi:hypothetical protein
MVLEGIMSDPQILICTPTYGTHITASINISHHHTIAGLIRDTHFNLAPASFGCDIVRARSRLARQFLQETPFSHLLFWDSDVTVASTQQAGTLIRRLVEADKPIVGCTYPMKRIQWDKVKAAVLAGKDPEAGAYDYPLNLAEDRTVNNGCLPVDGVPMGFCLIKRETLEVMTEHYASTLTFDDVVEGKSTPTVALFQLLIEKNRAGGRDLLGEDYAFCRRSNAIGLQTHLYCGPDSGLTHVGAYPFRGRPDGFVQ